MPSERVANGARRWDNTSVGQTESPGSEYPVGTSQTHLRVHVPVSVTVTDRARILSILTSLSASRALGTIRVVDANPPLGELDAPGAVELAPGPCLLVAAGFRATAEDCVWAVELKGQFSLVRFELAQKDRKARGYFTVPDAIECVYRRSERRASAPPAAIVRFQQQNGRAGWRERILHDVGFGGLQFVTEAGDQFCVGDQLLSAEVTWKHGPRIAILAEVRHISDSEVPTQKLCGVSLCPLSDAETDTWYQEISCLLHPNTMDASMVDPVELWDLYAASGYFGLDGRAESDYAHLKSTFPSISAKLEPAAEVSCRIVRAHQGRVEATISLLRNWSGGWLAYQAARRRERNPLVLSGNAVLRDIFLHAYETVQQCKSLYWHVTYVRKDARFSNLAYRDFAMPRIDNRSVAMVPFRAMQVFCAETKSIAPHRDLDIGLAEPRELHQVLGALADRFPVPYLESYDFVPERFELNELRHDWERRQLLRLRKVLVARRRGVPCAAAILDMVEPGIHLVGLLDSVHLVELHPKGSTEFPALLQATRCACADHGRKEFMLFEESGDPSAAIALGARDLGEADQIFISAGLTAEFLDHISAITAPRPRLVYT